VGIFIYPYKLYLYLFILLSFDRGLWPEWHESKETERRFPGQKGNNYLVINNQYHTVMINI
jgi:hypothetical protein